MTRPKRILMTADAVGGVWTYAVDLASGLAASGVQTTLAVLGPDPSPDQITQAEATPGLDLVPTGLPLDWTATEPAAIAEAGAIVRGLSRRVDADLVHLNSPALAADGGFSVPVLGACHSCLATWWSTVKEGAMPSDFFWRTKMLWRGLVACDVLLAPSASFAAATALTYELPRPFVIHNGRRPPDRVPQARQPLAFTSGRLWDDGKNASVLDEAAGLIGAPFFAAGPLAGPGGGELRIRHMTALGRLSAQEVGDWLGRASVFASSALYEPFGLGVLEAAQAGCALVLSDIPTFRELWDGAATFLPPDRPEAYAAEITRLLGDPEATRRMGERARARANRFTVEAMSSGTLEVYQQALHAFAPARRWEAVA
jgi:glycosyltransferase involved in cell wall biosynthesis